MPFVVKFQFGTDIRRVTTEKPFAWQEAADLVKNLFELNGGFVLKYKDEDGDVITVSTDRELDDAFRCMSPQNAIRFTVVPQAEKKANVNTSTNTNGQDRTVELDIDESLLPLIQTLIENFTPFLQGARSSGRWGGMRGCPFRGPQNSEPVPADAHVGVRCDGCQVSPIRGIRWKCTVCPDYDLCERCDKEGVHREHTFQKIAEPVRHPRCPRFQRENCGENVHFGVECDGCGQSPIRGIRNKCVTCPNYDLCESCEKKGVHKEHTFHKLAQPVRRWRGGNVNNNNEGPRWGRCGPHACPRNVPQEQAQTTTTDNSIPIKIVDDKKEATTPLVPLRKVEEPSVPVKTEEPVQVPVVPSSPKAEPKVEEPKKEEPKVEAPKKEEPKKEEKVVSPFEDKLNQLVSMGFVDTKKNLELLVKHKGDMVKAVTELLSL